MELKDLEVYQDAREISRLAWEIYKNLSWQDKKIFGDQFISAIDSVGANIAEGFGRFHYLDKNRFNYNSRGSLLEAIHWLEVMEERGKIGDEELGKKLKNALYNLHKKMNNYINATKRQTKS